MRLILRTSLAVALLAGASAAAMAQENYSVTSPGSGVTTTVRTKAYTPSEPVTYAAPASAPQEAPKPKVITTTVRTQTYTPPAPVAPVAPPVLVVTAPAAPVVSAPASAPMPAPSQVSMPAPAPAPETVSAPSALPAQNGQSLVDILARAYTDSPALRAEREVLRQQYENVAVAESYRRPTASIDGGIAVSNNETDPGGKDNLLPRDIGITGTQYLYRGGRTLPQIEQQLKLSDAALAAYDAATQDVFINVIVAAMDIQRDRATIELTEQNRTVVSRALESAQNGFKVGELTRTDVAQAQARLSGADAQLASARAAYSSALARFTQYSGMDGTNLRIADDAQKIRVPVALDAAKAAADTDHPFIRTAIEQERAAQSGIELAQGALRPDIYAQASAGKSWEPSSLVDSARDASIGLRASLPLYDGGASRALVRQARHQQLERRDRIADARRVVTQQVATAWNDYQASLAQISARDEQVKAAQVARDGVHNERQVGTRTVLDTLNADAELLDAQVGQVSARRDAVVAAYALQAATGQLTGEKLGLFSTDSEKAAREKTRKKWLGTDIQPAD